MLCVAIVSLLIIIIRIYSISRICSTSFSNAVHCVSGLTPTARTGKTLLLLSSLIWFKDKLGS